MVGNRSRSSGTNYLNFEKSGSTALLLELAYAIEYILNRPWNLVSYRKQK